MLAIANYYTNMVSVMLGALHIGVCPIHDGKMPSFIVERETFRCMICGVKGGPDDLKALVAEKKEG